MQRVEKEIKVFDCYEASDGTKFSGEEYEALQKCRQHEKDLAFDKLQASGCLFNKPRGEIKSEIYAEGKSCKPSFNKFKVCEEIANLLDTFEPVDFFIYTPTIQEDIEYMKAYIEASGFYTFDDFEINKVYVVVIDCDKCISFWTKESIIEQFELYLNGIFRTVDIYSNPDKYIYTLDEQVIPVIKRKKS